MSDSEHMERLDARAKLANEMIEGVIAAQTLEFYAMKLEDQDERDEAVQACKELVKVFNTVLNLLEVAI